MCRSIGSHCPEVSAPQVAEEERLEEAIAAARQRKLGAQSRHVAPFCCFFHVFPRKVDVFQCFSMFFDVFCFHLSSEDSFL